MKKTKTYLLLSLMVAAIIPWANAGAGANSGVKAASVTAKTTNLQTGAQWQNLYFNDILWRTAIVKKYTATVRKTPITPASITQTPTTNNTGTNITQNDLTVMEKTLFGLINDYRVKNGLKALIWNDKITETARQHSSNMASKITPFGHDGFSDRFNTLRSILKITAMAENVAYNYGYSDPAATAYNGWLNSSGHLKNMTGPYAISGIGIARDGSGRYYFTQIFAK